MVPLDDILALIFGILFVVRKLETARRDPAHYPHVPTPAFESWRSSEMSAYRLGSNACFLKALIGLPMFLLMRNPDLQTATAVIWTARVAVVLWLIAMITAFVRLHRASKERQRLRIPLAMPPPPDVNSGSGSRPPSD